jgi:phage terminase large subunit
MDSLQRHYDLALACGCPPDQAINFYLARAILQERQLLASAAARLCDNPEGPLAVGYGGARGGGKSHWLLAQMGADDCQRFPGLKCLLLRKVGKANIEHFEDLRQKLFHYLPHDYVSHKGVLTFANGSRIHAGHYQNEKDIDQYIGIEYDVVGVEEATTLTARKYSDITTCCRSSKVATDGRPWRPRLYSTTNPGGVGHAWYRARFIIPAQKNEERETRFIPARVEDNAFNNPEYRKVLERLTGWQRRAWLDGDWDIAAGQFFTAFRREVHIVDDFDETRAREWFAALDYGFTHYTVVLLGCKDGDGNIFIVDEHAQRMWLPECHARAIKEMFARHRLSSRLDSQLTALSTRDSSIPICRTLVRTPSGYQLSTINHQLPAISRFSAGLDVFSRQSDGTTIAQQYSKLGIRLTPANTDRINGWAEILSRFGEPGAGIRPRLFIHKRCARLLDCIPSLQHDPNRPEDVLKIDADEDGNGGDDSADALRYLISTKPREITATNLRGL